MKANSISRPFPLPALALGLGLAVAALLAGCASALQWRPDGALIDSLGPADWQADLDFLRAELPKRDPHFSEDQAMAVAFEAEALGLRASLAAYSGPELADRALAGMARVLALVGEGHSALNAYGQGSFPFQARWFADGSGGFEARLLALDPAYASIDGGGSPLDAAGISLALGARILGLYEAGGSLRLLSGEAEGEEPGVEALLDSAISTEADDDPATGIPSAVRAQAFRASRPDLLGDPRLVRGLGLASIVEGARTMRLRLAPSSGGAAFDLALRETGGQATDYRVLERPALPVYASSSEPRWYLRLDDKGDRDAGGRVLFVQYNSCDSDAWGFFQGVLEEAERGGVGHLVLDLRRNGGGNSAPGTWFAHRLAALPALNRDNGIHVLVGPATFSSAMWLSVDLMSGTAARFAGLPVAENPNGYGQVGRFALPLSGIVIGHSTKRHHYAEGKELRLEDGVIVPDAGLEIEQGFADWLAGKDPVLEKVLDEGKAP